MTNFKPIKDFKGISYNDIYKRFIISDKKFIKEINEIINNDEIPTFKNTIEKWSQLRIESNYYFYLLSMYQISGLYDKNIKKYTKISVKSTKDNYWIFNNKRFFGKIEYILHNESLTVEQKLIVEELHKGYILSGINLSKKDQKRMETLDHQIAQLASTIELNITRHSEELGMIIRLNEDLSEMPKEWLKSAKKMAKGKGYLVNDLNSATFYKKCKNSQFKKDYAKIQNQLASVKPYDNSHLITKLIKNYNELAKIKGFANHQEYSLHDKAFTVVEIKSILNNLLNKTKSHALKEREFFHKEGKRLGLEKVGGVDTSYISEQLKNKDKIQIEDYLEISTIFDGMNLMINKIFNCKMKRSSAQSFDKKFDVYDIFHNGKEIGQIHFDIYMRKNKTDTASLNTIQSPSYQCNYGQVYLQASIDPEDLDINDYATLFHELGHAMHVLLSKTKYDMSSGCGISRDLIEVPSTIFEHLCLSQDFMAEFLRNKHNHNSLPKNKKIIPREYGKIIDIRSSMLMSLVDLDVYAQKKINNKKIHNIEYNYFKEHGMFYVKRPKYSYTNSFVHVIGGGYESTYYVYFLAEVIAKSISIQFNKKGTNWKKKGEWVYNAIYSKGKSIPSKQILKSLVGESIDYNSFIKSHIN